MVAISMLVAWCPELLASSSTGSRDDIVDRNGKKDAWAVARWNEQYESAQAADEQESAGMPMKNGKCKSKDQQMRGLEMSSN